MTWWSPPRCKAHRCTEGRLSRRRFEADRHLGQFTKGNYEAAISTLFEGAILAVIVVMLFLRDIRATIIAAISLPLSIFPAFWAMDILGFR